MNAKQAAEKHVAQSQEEWQLRAIKLLLLRSDMFPAVASCLMAQEPQRIHTRHIFRLLLEQHVLEQIGFGEFTEYRMSLLIKACRNHMRQCTRGVARGRKHQTQSPPSP